jgi:hypothetical protein
MANLPPCPDSNDGTGVGTGRGSRRSRPRWVKVFGIILVKFGIIALVLVRGLRIPLVAGHVVALLVLLVAAAVTLAVHNLRGYTPHEWRKQHERPRSTGEESE